MPTSSFTVAFPATDCDIAADAVAAVFNNAAAKTTYVAICEVRIVPQARNDDVSNITGNQGILGLERITAASGGTTATQIAFDTAASALSNVTVRVMPDSVTISGGTIRRFGDCVSTFTITKALPFRVGMRAPGVTDANDHSGRTSEGQDIWHADGAPATEPIVLRAGEGIALIKRAWGQPQGMHIRLVVRNTATGRVYTWDDSGLAGTPDELNKAIFSFMNESGSGLVLQVYVIMFPDLGEENQPRFRVVRCGAGFQDGFVGTSVTPSLHDTAGSVTDLAAYAGPMKVFAYARKCGAQVNYYDYQILPVTTAEQQKVDTFRQWLHAGTYTMKTTGSPVMLWDVLSRAEPELWPGDRRGTGSGVDMPIFLWPGEGLAVIGGGNGLIETSELAYIQIEMAGYVYTAPPVVGGSGGVSMSRVVNQ